MPIFLSARLGNFSTFDLTPVLPARLRVQVLETTAESTQGAEGSSARLALFLAFPASPAAAILIRVLLGNLVDPKPLKIPL